MRAAVLHEYGEPLEIRDVPPPEPEPDGAVVRVEACGICRSDWHAWQGHGEWADDQVPLGHVLGHEPAGEVIEVGTQVEHVSVGDRVIIPFSLGDGTCQYCRTGRGNVCQRGTALGFDAEAPGAFAERVAVPAAEYNLAALPPFLDTTEAAALGCRYVTAFHALTDRAELSAADTLAVHGCGGVGLSIVQLAAALGAHVIAVDPKADARSRASALGASTVVDPSDRDPVEAVKGHAGGGVDVSVDALGIAETCQNSIACLRPRGIHVQVGLTTDAERGSISVPTDRMTRWEYTFVGARGMPPTSYPELFSTLDHLEIDLTALVSQTVSLEDVSDRLDAMSDFATDGIEVVTP